MRKSALAWTACFGLLIAAGCTPSSIEGADTESAGTAGTDAQTPAGDTGTVDAGGSTQKARVVTGTIAAAGAPKHAAQSVDAGGYQVVMQSAASFQMYSGISDSSGAFSVDIPADEDGSLFMVMIIDPRARPVGPLVFDASGDQGFTGLELTEDASFGTIALTEGADAALAPGADADLGANQVADDVTARLNDDGAPVGAGSLGKGADAQGAVTDNPRQACDADQDGMIDVFDADNDGDGTIDDFDNDGGDGSDGVFINIFMNLKIDETRAGTYYGSVSESIDEALETDTVITFEVRGEAGLDSAITAARVLETPGPAYLPNCTVLSNGPEAALWSASGYALMPDGDNHFQQWVVPHDLLDAGDTFTVEVTLADGSTRQYARMINYVFRNIPRLVEHGPAGARGEYDSSAPLELDRSQDLELVFNPPIDETGAYLFDLDYRFEIFYQAAGGQQLNGEIDGAATWPAAPEGFRSDVLSYDVVASGLTLSGDNTYTISLPAELFPASVQLKDGSSASVASYKVDVAAQRNGNNAAIMLNFVPK